MQGGPWPPLARKFVHFDHWSDQKSGLSPHPPEIEKWLGSPEPSPRAPESPPLEKFLPTPLGKTVFYNIVSLCVITFHCSVDWYMCAFQVDTIVTHGSELEQSMQWNKTPSPITLKSCRNYIVVDFEFYLQAHFVIVCTLLHYRKKSTNL